MPPQGKGTTAADGLKSILGEIAQLAALPDADPKFFTQIQMAITQHLRSAGQGQPGQGQGQPGQGPMGQPPMGQPQPGMGGPPQAAGPPPPSPGMGGGFGGASVTGQIARPGGPNGAPPVTSPDELRRILQQGNQ